MTQFIPQCVPWTSIPLPLIDNTVGGTDLPKTPPTGLWPSKELNPSLWSPPSKDYPFPLPRLAMKRQHERKPEDGLAERKSKYLQA